MTAGNNNLRIRIWDMGPKAPDAPKRPTMPKDLKEGSPEFMVAEHDFKASLSLYDHDTKDFVRLKREFDSWQHLNGGPYQIEMWSVNAIEAMQRDKDRYVLSLPRGVKPGKAHIENERREQVALEELAALRARDPQFGRGVALS